MKPVSSQVKFTENSNRNINKNHQNRFNVISDYFLGRINLFAKVSNEEYFQFLF